MIFPGFMGARIFLFWRFMIFKNDNFFLENWGGGGRIPLNSLSQPSEGHTNVL